MLTIYNSLTRSKETFIPLRPGKVGLYVCGITVYDHCHLGHARSMLCFDVMVRFLRAQGYAVTFVRNITDIDDKIIARAHERGISIQALTQDVIASMEADARCLGILPPDKEPRATDHMQGMITLIACLIEKGHAYVSAEGDVCYHVEQFPGYGKLSHKNIDGLEAGARVEVVHGKRSPLDFVLWKMAKPQEPCWPSPWGNGRPGWHIECSAMAMDALGEQFDIHGGGLDLQFPHHENEIAQSEAATGKPFANYWLHVGLLQVNHEKMSKSTGNFVTIADALKKHHPEVIRYFLMSSHYRSPLNYSDETMLNAKKALTRLYQSLKDKVLTAAVSPVQKWIDLFNEAMNDDFNTPEALSVLFQLSRALNKTNDLALAVTLKHLAGTLGLLQCEPGQFLQGDMDDVSMIQSIIDERLQARLARDWLKADALREQLAQHGIELEDSTEGTTWRRIAG